MRLLLFGGRFANGQCVVLRPDNNQLFIMPSALVFYQYYYPDDVVSAVHFKELAEGLADRGWQVTTMPCNRSCRSDHTSYASHEVYSGVDIRRIWRPAWPQEKNWGRLANSIWMICLWSWVSLFRKPDVLIIGTDPIVSLIVAIPWRLFRPSTRIVHWCLDLYPEAAVVDGLLKPGFVLSALRFLMRSAYRRCNLIADIGTCMRRRLAAYDSPARTMTLAPWALAESDLPLRADPAQRSALFGSANLGVMYSGNFGRAHSFAELLSIARQLHQVDVHFSFSIRGNRADEVRQAVTADDRNISFAPFAPKDQLEARLGAADVHVVSLRPQWAGVVVPSKFFGALAAGRPVLFIGDQNSWIAEIINEHNLGWVCTPGRESLVAEQLRPLVDNKTALQTLCQRCHAVYRKYFARQVALDSFDLELRSLLSGKDFRGNDVVDEPRARDLEKAKAADC